MEKATYFNVSSVTNAMRSKVLLEQQGFRAYVSRTVDAQGKNGCGYSVMVTQNGERAERILREAGIRIVSTRKGGDTA